MRIHAFRAILPNPSLIAQPVEFFQQCKDDYLQLIAHGIFQAQLQPAIYRYELEQSSQTIQGIIAAVDIRDYLENHIKKHEHTLLYKEQTQCRIFESQQAFVKPVLATYPACRDITAWLQEMKTKYPLPCLCIQEAPHAIHRLFAITEAADITRLETLFNEEVSDIFIADGHHRCAAAASLFLHHPEKPFAVIPCALLDTDAISIHGFHRIATLETTTTEQFLQQLSSVADIQPCQPVLPSRPHELTFRINQRWFVAQWKKEVLQRHPDPVVLDVQLLNTLVFEKILGISDVRNSSRITYVEGPAGMTEFEQQLSAREPAVGVCLYPISTDSFMQGAMAQLLFPPKSTWFEPRMRSGLLVCPWK